MGMLMPDPPYCIDSSIKLIPGLDHSTEASFALRSFSYALRGSKISHTRNSNSSQSSLYLDARLRGATRVRIEWKYPFSGEVAILRGSGVFMSTKGV